MEYNYIRRERDMLQCSITWMHRQNYRAMDAKDVANALQAVSCLYIDKKHPEYGPAVAAGKDGANNIFPIILFDKPGHTLVAAFKNGKIYAYITGDAAIGNIGACMCGLIEVGRTMGAPAFIFEPSEVYRLANLAKLFYKGRIGTACLFTGAFNPPTIAHYHMIDAAMSASLSVGDTDGGQFDFIILATSNQQFVENKLAKKGGGIAFTEGQRVSLLLEMTKDRGDTLVYGVEQGYTYDVLTAVKDRYGIKDLYFALGSDKLHEIERWGHHDRLLREFCFYVLQRREDENYIKSKCRDLFAETDCIVSLYNPAKDTYDGGKYKDVSSTQAREMIAEGQDYSSIVTENVYQKMRQYLKSK